MSSASKADTLTPLMRLQRRKRAAMIFFAFMAACLILLASIVLAVNDGRNYRRLLTRFGFEHYLSTSSQAPPAAQRYHRVSRLPDRWSRIIAPAKAAPGVLLQETSLTAEERCARLQTDDGAQSTFQSSDNEWECIFQRELGSAPEPSVLFVQIRGSDPAGDIRTFRMKLSLLDPSVDRQILDLPIEIIDGFEIIMSAESHDYLRGMIAEKREFSSLLENYRISFERERSDERRFNLLLIPRPATRVCADLPSADDGRPMQSAITLAPIGCVPLRSIS